MKFNFDINLVSEVCEELRITDKELEEILGSCKFKDPEVIGLISLFCPLLCLEIPKRVLGKIYRGWLWYLYFGSLYVWYCLSIFQLLSGQMTINNIIVFGFILVSVSSCFRLLTKSWNTIEILDGIKKKRTET